MRLPKPGEPFIAATNHFVSYGVDDKTDPSPDPQSPWRNFRLAVGRESYWRYQAVLETLRSRFRSAIPLGGLSAAGEVLKRAAHGSTEHSIAFDPQSLQIALAVAEPAASGAWDAPYSQWTTYTFEQLFSDGPGGGAENRSTCVPERPVQTGGAALGIFLTVGAIIAAIPQLLQLVKRRSSVGVSPFTLTLCLCYMTCNVCSTTLAKWSTLRACGEGAGCLLHLLDFTQQVAAGVAYVLILVAVTSFAPHDGRRTRLAVYSTMAALTVVIIVACVFASHSPCSTASRDLADGFASAAALVVLVAFVPQLVDTWRNAGRGSISYLFFTIQAVGCFLVATNELVVNHDPWTIEEQLMAAPDPETGTPAITFYVDVMEAQAKLAAVQAVNPGAELQLSVAPLGTAFAMSSQSQEDMVVRLQPSQAVMNGVRESLGFPAADASGAQPVPLFGSDELNFELPPGPECPEGGEMTPLFFAVDDLRAAWVASGQPADKLPALQLTDLRTLAYNMEHDSTKDWSPVLLIAPEAAIDFVKGGATASPPKAKEEEEAPELSGADVQSLLFGDDSDNPFGNKKTIRF